MSLQVVAMLVIAAAGVVGQLLLLAYFLGGKSNTISNHDKALGEHDAKLDDHGNRIISLEEWRKSYGGD